MKSTISVRTLPAYAAILCLTAATRLAMAEMSQKDVDRLGKDLTPVGAEKAGNKEGSIPAWDGGLTKAPAGFDQSKGYIDPFAGEKPLYTITAANAAQYKEKLAPGQLEMLKRYPTFKINVFPTHRSAAYPQSVYNYARSESPKIKLAAGGNGMVNVDKSTVPFPVPQNALEVLWNHEMRFYGGVWTRYNAEFPVQTNGTFTPITRNETIAAAWALEKSEPNRRYYYISKLTGPSHFAGAGILVHEPVDQVA